MSEYLTCYRGAVYKPPIEKVPNFLAVRNPITVGKPLSGTSYSIGRIEPDIDFREAASWALDMYRDAGQQRGLKPMVLEVHIGDDFIAKHPSVINKINQGSVPSLTIETPVTSITDLIGSIELSLNATILTSAAYALLGLKVYQFGKEPSFVNHSLYKDYSSRKWF